MIFMTSPLEFEDLTLDGLEVIATLGIGGFGRVALVQVKTLMYNLIDYL